MQIVSRSKPYLQKKLKHKSVIKYFHDFNKSVYLNNSLTGPYNGVYSVYFEMRMKELKLKIPVLSKYYFGEINLKGSSTFSFIFHMKEIEEKNLIRFFLSRFFVLFTRP